MPLLTLLSNENKKTIKKAEGQSYNFDNRSGKFSVWTLSTLLVGISTFHESEVTQDTTALRKDGLAFVIRTIYKISPKMYTFQAVSKMDLKLTSSIATGEPGSSSYVFIDQLEDANTGDFLMERFFKSVVVDKTHRRPMKLDKWFQQKYYDPSNSFLKLMMNKNAPNMPKECYTWATNIRFSDQDENMHTNQSVYLKLCIDAIANAAINDKLKHYKGDICFYPVYFADITFIDECFPNDEIEINVWQDKTDRATIRCLIMKGNKHITYTVFQFGLEKFIPKPKSNM